MKPNLKHAKIISTKVTIPSTMMKFISSEAIQSLNSIGMKEIVTENLGIGEWFILKEYIYDAYDKFITEGCRTELSLYRLTRGCNNLSAFEKPGAEKSEDYDSLDASKILFLPSNYEEALSIIQNKFIGKKLRVVARSAENSDSYGKRYYLFSIDE